MVATQIFFYFHPEPEGEDDPILDDFFFSNGLKPPTSIVPGFWHWVGPGPWKIPMMIFTSPSAGAFGKNLDLPTTKRLVNQRGPSLEYTPEI